VAKKSGSFKTDAPRIAGTESRNENLTASPDKPHMLQGAEIGFRLNIKKSTLPH
jgi:hypothetical protein